jgi:hypothetical protein
MSPYRPEEINGPVVTSSVPGTDALHSELRCDLRQRDIVASGIAMLAGGGVMMVVEYLKLHAIGAHVIERVLLEPHRRRAPC